MIKLFGIVGNLSLYKDIQIVGCSSYWFRSFTCVAFKLYSFLVFNLNLFHKNARYENPYAGLCVCANW